MMSEWMDVWDTQIPYEFLLCQNCDQGRAWEVDERGERFPDHPLDENVDWVIFADGVRTCRHCGCVDDNFHPHVGYSVDMENQGKARGREGTGGDCPKWKWGQNTVPCTALPERGRYKEKFHYNERIAQWFMLDPDIPQNVWKRLEDEALSGKYGPPEGFTRATDYQLTK